MNLKALSVGCLVVGAASVALGIEEPFCTVPANCVEDVLNVKFTRDNTSTHPKPAVGDFIDVYTSVDVKSKFTGQENCAQEPIPDPPDPPPPIITECSNLQGWSYGVKHDIAVLEIQSATHKGTPLFDVRDAFLTTQIAQGRLGFIQAAVVTTDSAPPFDLPIGAVNQKIAILRYKVLTVPGAKGTKLEYTNDLNPPKSPPTATNLTIAGKSKQPKVVNNAIVEGEAAPLPCTLADYGFYFGGAANAAEFDIAAANEVKVTLRNKGVALGFSLGIKKTGANLTFESTLGAEAGREVELVVTKSDGTEVNGAALKGNTARGAPATNIASVDRGAAIAGLANGTFFMGVDIIGTAAPDVGGPGVTVGFVADVSGSGATIPAVTDTGTTCGGNEVLIVRFGEQPRNLSRGDANGDRKINVTDGVIIAQNIFANRLVLFDCKDMLDANDDGSLNTADPVFLLTYVFLKGPAPAAPFRVCGPDPTNDNLACVQANCT